MPKIIEVLDVVNSALKAAQVPPEEAPGTKAWNESTGVTGGLQASLGGLVVAGLGMVGLVVDWTALVSLGVAVGGVWTSIHGLRSAWGRFTATTIIRK